MVALGQKRLGQGPEDSGLQHAEKISLNEVDRPPDLFIAVVNLAWIVARPASVPPLERVSPKMKMLSLPTSSMISTLAPSRVPMVKAPLSCSFMLPVPDASVPASEICSLRSAAGMIFSANDTR